MSVPSHQSPRLSPVLLDVFFTKIIMHVAFQYGISHYTHIGITVKYFWVSESGPTGSGCMGHVLSSCTQS